LTFGGDKAAYDKVLPLVQVIAAPHGCAHVGPSGAGHYVKMVHNGIEYGLLQAYGEGLQLLSEGAYKDLDIKQVVDVWMHGCVIRSWLLHLAAGVVADAPQLTNVVGEIQEGGTGRWAADEAGKHGVPVPVLQAALEVRKKSRLGEHSFATRFIAKMRQVFGGHSTSPKGL
jgi:6-phosphogluconate dehydrogenase